MKNMPKMFAYIILALTLAILFLFAGNKKDKGPKHDK